MGLVGNPGLNFFHVEKCHSTRIVPFCQSRHLSLDHVALFGMVGDTQPILDCFQCAIGFIPRLEIPCLEEEGCSVPLAQSLRPCTQFERIVIAPEMDEFLSWPWGDDAVQEALAELPNAEHLASLSVSGHRSLTQ